MTKQFAETDSNLAVEFVGVSAGYRGQVILKNVSLSIARSKIVGISGPNGSGKTTLLRTIQGILPVSSGVARVLGLDLIGRNYPAIRLRTACVFQSLNVDPRTPVSAGEVVMMGRFGRIGLLKQPGKADYEAVARAMEITDALHLRDRPFGQLSGGEKQRINLARALAQEPELLLLDEPTTFLDSDSQQRVREIVKTIHAGTGITTIVVSHDAQVISDLCEQIITMEDGAIVHAGANGDNAGV
jgi:ABC-type cobalamin/Fe3+-siderophores transport system ATPase subunit